jgi:hypothetical protein
MVPGWILLFLQVAAVLVLFWGVGAIRRRLSFDGRRLASAGSTKQNGVQP